MPDDKGNVSEQEKAELSKQRGQAAAAIKDPEERRKFVMDQGNTEAAHKGNLPVLEKNRLENEAATKTALASYKKGTDRVPKTGPANLHKDEAVLPKDEAEKYRSAKSNHGDMKHIFDLASENMGGDKAAPKKEVKEIRTRKAKSGGYIHEHHHKHPEAHLMEEHTSADQDGMVAHMMEHMGTPNDGEAAPDAEQPTMAGE